MPRCRLAVQVLEDRATPVVWNTPWPDPGHMTLSFAPDGTDIRGTRSALFRELADMPAADWQRETLRAFQEWAAVANINLSVVPDSGVAFGTPGPLQGDPRHGDVRLGATNLAPTQIAAATPFDLFGGWSGSVLLNKARSFDLKGGDGLADLYTVLLQESGHVFGVPNSPDPGSAMFTEYLGPRAGLSPADVDAIRELYGARLPDRFEGRRGNETIDSASRLASAGPISADLTTSTDVDVYRVRVPAGSDTFTVTLTTGGVSLLTARLTVLDKAGREVASAVATDPVAGNLSITVPGARAGSIYYVRVQGAGDDVFSIGAYRLTVGPPPVTTGAVLPGLSATNSPAPVLNQTTAPDHRWDFTGRARLGNSHEVDRYRVKTRKGDPGTLVAAVWGLQTGGLNPKVTVRDDRGREVPADVLTDAAGTFTLQVRDVRPQTRYRIEVAAADPRERASRGDYVLAVDFRDQAIAAERFAATTLTTARPAVAAAMIVTETQLLHFALATVTADARVESAARLVIRDWAGREVFTLFAAAGRTASGDVLLPAGWYSVVITAGTRVGTEGLPNLGFTLSGLVRTDPIGIVPVDPSGDPRSPPAAPPPDTTTTKPYVGPYTNPYRAL